MVKPRRTIRSSTLKASLKNFLLPNIVESYRICSLRCLWEVMNEDNEIVLKNIWSKRKQLEQILNSFKDVVLYFSCLTAMESNEIRRKLKERKRKISADHRISGSDTDNEYESYEDSGIFIPGKTVICI